MGETVTIAKDDFIKLKESISISKYKYEELTDTIDVLTDKKTKKEIQESLKQIKNGKFCTVKDI